MEEQKWTSDRGLTDLTENPPFTLWIMKAAVQPVPCAVVSAKRIRTLRAGGVQPLCCGDCYYEQNVTTERFEDFDGERWIMLEDQAGNNPLTRIISHTGNKISAYYCGEM